MDAQDDGRTREVLFVFCERFLDVELFELADRLVEEYVAFQHFVDQGFKSGTHDQSEVRPARKSWRATVGRSPNLQLFRLEPYSSFPVSSR